MNKRIKESLIREGVLRLHPDVYAERTIEIDYDKSVVLVVLKKGSVELKFKYWIREVLSVIPPMIVDKIVGWNDDNPPKPKTCTQTHSQDKNQTRKRKRKRIVFVRDETNNTYLK